DEQDDYADLHRFVEVLVAAGLEVLIVHARKAWLQGLSPKENREVPPLDYDRVYRLKAAHPELEIVINGGVETLDDAGRHLQHVDGVMLGRAAYQTPYVLADVDRRFYGDARLPLSRHEVLEAFMPYVARELARGTHLHAMSRHILGLFQGMPGARAFRRYISENAPKRDAGAEVIRDAMALVPREALAVPA
ncbi:MAG TPA: tRNA-dihydrouridine synthase, partial [Parvibaculum sp.]